MRIALCTAFAVLSLSGTHAKSSPDLSWLSGYWLSCSDGREVAETWSVPRAGMLVGSTVTFEGDQVSFEYARISSTNGGLSYFASPNGQAAVAFALKDASDNRAVFENLKHDFPQRVIYERRGSELRGRIEGMQDGKPLSFEWQYRSVNFNARCERT
jgi:hypothetical protein